MYRQTFAQSSFFVAVSLVCGLMLQCKSRPNNAEEHPLGPADQTYTVRGKIVQLPGSNAGSAEIQHESIPSFVNASNERVGMAAMTMPFHLAPEIRLDSFSVGDLVAFTFEVHWNSEPQLRIREMSHLAEGTLLQLGR